MAPESTFCNLGTDLLHSQVMEEKSASHKCAPSELMAPTDNSTAKIGKTKSSSFIPRQVKRFQSHLYCIVRLSTSLIPPYAINSSKEKLKIKPIVQFLKIYLAFLSLFMSYSYSFVTSEMYIITSSLHSWTGFLINYYSWTEQKGWWFGVFVLVCFYFVISVWMCFPVPEEQK